MNYVLIGIVVLLFLKAGWSKLSGTVEKGSELTNGWSLNLDQTVPGKLINSVLGYGWANWVIWPIVILIIILVVRSFVTKKKGAGSTTSSPISWTAIIISLGVAGIIALAYTWTTMKVDERNHTSGHTKVNLLQVKDGGSVVKKANLQTVFWTIVRTVHAREAGVGGIWACPELTNQHLMPVKIMFEVVAGDGTNENMIAMTKGSQEYILSNFHSGIVEVKFTTVMSAVNPCQYLLTK